MTARASSTRDISSAVRRPSIAQPARVLTHIGGSQRPATWLASHGYVFSGWGGGRPIRRTASAAFAEYPFAPFGKLELNMMRLTGSGGVALELGDSGSPGFITAPRCRSDLRIEERYVSGVAQGIQGAGGRFVATFAPGGFEPACVRQPNVGRWIASALYPPESAINAVEATIVTGDDGLREHSLATARIRLAGGRWLPAINLNSGAPWSAGSVHTITMPVPTGTRLADLHTFKVEHQGLPVSSTDAYDTWKVAGLHVAFRVGQQCPVNLWSRAGSPLVSLASELTSWETVIVVP